MKKYNSVDDYIKDYPQETQVILEKMRQTIKKVAPDATEAIAYGIPTFKLKGNLVHFGWYPHHIGFYPGAEAIEVFGKQLMGYKTSKGTVQFQLSEPTPYDLVAKITEFRVKKSTKIVDR